jgi:hypothetical protein
MREVISIRRMTKHKGTRGGRVERVSKPDASKERSVADTFEMMGELMAADPGGSGVRFELRFFHPPDMDQNKAMSILGAGLMAFFKDIGSDQMLPQPKTEEATEPVSSLEKELHTPGKSCLAGDFLRDFKRVHPPVD